MKPSYLNLCTEFYDLTKPEARLREIDFYEALVRASKGPVLEAMCGSERLLIPLLKNGLLPESFESYQIVQQGDVIVRPTDLQNDQRSLRTAIALERGIITSDYLAIEPVYIQSRFLHYLMRAYDLLKVFYSLGGGLRQSLKFADILPSA
jgi:hypothetical protein